MFGQKTIRSSVLPLSHILLAGIVAMVTLSSALVLFYGFGPVSLGSDLLTKELPLRTYAHNWDDNLVAYIPEAEALGQPASYAHNWDGNLAAYIPEAEALGQPASYAHNWDDNPVAYIPEAWMTRQTN